MRDRSELGNGSCVKPASILKSQKVSLEPFIAISENREFSRLPSDSSEWKSFIGNCGVTEARAGVRAGQHWFESNPFLQNSVVTIV